jgi:hypothetical protein
VQAEIITKTEPTSCFTGKLWIEPRPAITNVWLKLGSEWVLLTQSLIPNTVFNSTKDILFLIEGEDKTEYLEKDTLSITDTLNEVDTCSFGLIGSAKPIVGQEVEIYKYDGSNFIKQFGGEIISAEQSRTGIAKYRYSVECNDYSESAKKKLVVETYENMYVGEIIKDLVNNYAEELGTFYVDNGNLLAKYQFNYRYPFDCITELAGLMGWSWYVDIDRNIHFFSNTTNVAPYTLTDNRADAEYQNLTIMPDKTQLRNKIIIRGGYYLSEAYTQERVADGTQTSFNLDYEGYAPVTVYVDSGAGYVLKTLGIDNIDTGKDFVFNFTEKVVKNQDHATLDAGDLIKIMYSYKIPVLVEQSRQDSIDAMKVYEGGDGIYEYLLIDENIQTKAIALKRAIAELDIYANPIVEGVFTTMQEGYRSGQLLTVNIPSRGINEQYLIQTVTATSIGMGNFEYEITFGAKLLGLAEFLMDMFENNKTSYQRNDEILTKIGFVDDGLVISDIVASTEIRVPSTRPYTYGVDADAGRYGVSSYA